MPNRREFLGSLAAGAGLIGFGFRSTAQSAVSLPPLRLGFFTDVHARTDLRVPEALNLAVKAMNEEEVDLWICGGDVINRGYLKAASECVDSFKVFTDFLGQIDQPVYPVIGNHDLAGAFPADGSPPAIDPTALWRDAFQLDGTYQSFDHGGIHYFLIDSVELTSPPLFYRGYVNQEQIAWLTKELSKIPAEKPIVLVSHIPFRTVFIQVVENPSAPLPENLVVENANEILELFKGRNLPLVLQGHLHSNELIDWAGRTFLMGGAICGGWWEGPNRDTGFGYGVVDVSDGQIQWTYKGYGWA
ncbi:MAG: metallophosphoesterase [Verrucomicrobiota bacterium]